MLATGARIGEALAVLWRDVGLAPGTVQITSTVVRDRDKGLRKDTKSTAGESTLPLPSTALAMVQEVHD